MAIKFQYNKTSLGDLDKQLKMRTKALPTIKSKESALRLEVKKAKDTAEQFERELNDLTSQYDYMTALWGEFDPDLLRIKDVDMAIVKIAGVRIPVLKGVEFEEKQYDLFSSPVWIADGVQLLKQLANLRVEYEFFLQKMRLLDHARKKTTQKVNLYEKVQIPGYEEAIRKIKRFLEDEENLSKSSQKIVKSRQAQAAKVEDASMIVPMKKYDIVVFHREKEEFLERLQDLGLVDITTTGWEPDECERERIILIDRMKAAVTKLREIASEDDYQPSEPIGDGCEAFECYTSAANAVDSVNARITQAEKELGELQVWGEFDPAKLDALRGQGVSLHFFSAYTKEFEAAREQWEQQYTIFPVSDVDGFTYFVVITAPDTEVAINAQQLKPLTVSVKDKQLEIAALGKEKQRWTDQLQKCASSADAIERQMEVEKEKLHISQVSDSGVEAAEGTLVVMEGWATKETALNVDRMLEQYPGVFYVKADPTPDDDTPTLLKNNRFNKLFEFIGNFYSLPKYGTMDLTSAFGPFYVLFFGMCLGDAGYGLLYLIGGIVMLQKLKPSLHGVARLVILCGISTVICGGFMGSFFGIEYAAYEPFARVRSYILSTDNLFVLALAIGMFQILFGMVLKVIMYTKSYGFKYALATLGWIIVIVSSLAAYFLPELGVEGFSMSSIPYYACLGIGAFMMLFLNSPGKNPFLNLGAGLWNTYNDVTGLLSDVLSYIRLFAIGLSGGILALVFNQLALGLSPEIPVVRQVSIVLILLIGHGINLFMSSLSAFVHPMRLTFVEFYKNAGFETTMREFTPLKRSQKTTNNN